MQEFLATQVIANEIMELPGTNFSTQLLSAILNQRPLEPISQVTSFLDTLCSSARLKGKVAEIIREFKGGKTNQKQKAKDAAEDKEETTTKRKSRDTKAKSEAINTLETQSSFAAGCVLCQNGV